MNEETPPERPDVLLVETEQPFWTPWRIVYAIIAIIVILAVLATLLWPLLAYLSQPSLPTPVPAEPLPRV